MSFNSDSKSIEKYHLLYIFLCSKVHKKLIYLTNSYKILVIKKKLKKKIYIYRFERFDCNDGRRSKGLGHRVTGMVS